MQTIRRSHERGHAEHGWLTSRHTFTFAGYHDRQHMGFRSLRVMNEDWIAPGQGFGTHPHRDMEIITYVLEGELEHRDSMGNGAVLRAGDFQRMTAGTGIEHSEFNPSPTTPAHLYQIWLFPAAKGLTPSYEDRSIAVGDKHNRLLLVAAPQGRDGTLAIQQDAQIWLGQLDAGFHLTQPLQPDRHAWLQVLSGSITAAGTPLSAGDALAVSDMDELSIAATTNAEVLLFDLA